MSEAADPGRRRFRADVGQIATANEGRVPAARADGAVAEAANETTTSEKPGDDPMTPDEFARAAYPLLHEGIVLLRAHAGEGPAIERHVTMVEKVREQYRAAKEAPAPAPDGAPPGFRIVGRSGPGVRISSGTWARDASAPGLAPLRWPGFFLGGWPDGRWNILEPIPAPAPEPSAPPKCEPWCGKTSDSYVPAERPCAGDDRCVGGPTHGGCWCSGACSDAGRPLNPPPSDPVTVATGGEDDAQIHPCLKCGVMRSKREGGTVFTVCDACWDKNPPTDVKINRNPAAWIPEASAAPALRPCRCGHAAADHVNGFGHLRDCGVEVEAGFCGCAQYREVDAAVATGGVDDDEIPTAEEGAETVKRLGIDVPAWAADIRKRVAAVATGGVPAGYRLGAGWEFCTDRDDWHCWHGIDEDTFEGDRCQGKGPYFHASGKGACADHAVEMGALVPIDTARSVPPGPVPTEAARPICDFCGGDERPGESSGAPEHFWACEKCVRKQPGLRRPKAPAAAPSAAPASEPAVRPLSSRMRTDREELRALLLKNSGRLLGGELGTLARFGGHEEEVAVLEAELKATYYARDIARAEVNRERPRDEKAVAYTCCSGVNGDHEVFCSSLSAEVLRAFQQPTRVAMQRAGAPAVRKVAALEVDLADANSNRMRAEVEQVDARKERDAARAEVEQLRGKLAEAREALKLPPDGDIAKAVGKLSRTLNDTATTLEEVKDQATGRVRSMREAAATATRTLDHAHDVVTGRCSRCAVLQQAARGIERLPLDTGTATDTGGEAAGERCNWSGCHCGGLGKKTEFVPMALEDISQLLAEVATFHRWGATRMQGLDRQMRRLGWYRKRARAWKTLAKKAADKANNRAADAFHEWWPGYSSMWRLTPGQFEAWLRSGEDAPGAVGK